ncbi:MAG: SDR family oxidoreductase [Gemmatimonadetes bacterium]|nr:SDR family oxidoreductase [Gemmatimonadota bacterium]
MVDLRGKRALVTGGSRGIGAATAILLARAGADVGIAYRSRSSDAERVLEEIRRQGVRGWGEAADLRDPAAVDRLFARCREAMGGLDIFVANAGIWNAEPIPLADMPDAEWREMIDTNLTSVFLTTRAALSLLSEGGRVVIVSSTAGQRGEAFHAHYAATKGALLSLVKSLCVECAPRRITVNAVAPGWVDTEMSAPALQGPERDAILGTIPLGRPATAEEIAGPIVFLCSGLAAFITGEILNVNGGAVLCG